MNWDAIGAIAELFGAFGVIASLIYLAAQIRQNTESVRMTSHHGVAVQFNQSNLVGVQDPELSDLVTRGIRGDSSLSEAERFRFEGYVGSIFRTYEELYQLHRKGLADQELWDSRERNMMRWLSSPAVRSWWASERSNFFIASFRAYVEDRLSGIPARQAPGVEESR